MILSEIRDYLQARGRASIGDLATRFDAEPDAVRGMLQTYIRKGRVRQLGWSENLCAGCTKCEPAQVEVYEWLGREAGGQSARPRHGTTAGTCDRYSS